MNNSIIVLETWRTVPKTARKYEVSTRGRVRSFCRGKPRILRTALMSGYPSVTIYYEGRKKSMTVHQLMGDAFLEQNYWVGTDKEVNHKDGDKTNNHIANLEVITQAENSRHAHRNGLASTPIISKLSEGQVRDIRRRVENGEVQRRIAERYRVSFALITMIKQRRCWRQVQPIAALNAEASNV